MTKTELTEWFEKEWWPRYLNFVKTPFKSDWGAGAKGKALTKMLQINPSEDLRTAMVNAIIAQTRHRRLLYDRLGSQKAYDDKTAPLAKGGEAVYQNRQGSTYLHNRGWTDEIPALDMEEKQTFGTNCKCGQPTHGPNYTECQTCMGFKDKKLKNYLGTGIGPYGDTKRYYSQAPVKEHRVYFIEHKEIRTFNREQHLAFIKDRLRKVGSGGKVKHDNHVKDYYVFKYNLDDKQTLVRQ